MKTPSELKAHYRDVIIPMVAQYNYDHGTDVRPWECVRVTGSNEAFLKHPTFTLPTEDYKFALTILESRPVFVGDRLYGKKSPVEILAADGHTWGFYTWTQPAKKRTFVLNGVELPCPVKNEDAPQKLWIWGQNFYFDTVGHDAVWLEAIRELLTEARDKE